MSEQLQLFENGSHEKSDGRGNSPIYHAEYLRSVMPVIEALGAQLGQTDEETSGYFRLVVKQGTTFMNPTWSDGADIILTTNVCFGKPEDNLSYFSSKSKHYDQVFEGFLMAVGRNPGDGRIYGVFYANCTDVGASKVCVDLLDIMQIGRYSDNAKTIMAMYQNAIVDGRATCDPFSSNKKMASMTVSELQHIIDRYWPEPEIVYELPFQR